MNALPKLLDAQKDQKSWTTIDERIREGKFLAKGISINYSNFFVFVFETPPLFYEFQHNVVKKSYSCLNFVDTQSPKFGHHL